MARIPIRDRRTQRLRPIATPSQGQPEIAPETLVGEALQRAAQLAMQGQKIKQHFETIRLQEAYNKYVAESEREFQKLQQLRGYAPLDKEGYEASLLRLQEFRENQLSELPAHLRRKYELMLANRVTKDTIRFRGYALSEAEKAAAQTAEVAEAQVVEDAAKVTTFEAVQSLIQSLNWIEDPETGEKAPGAVRSHLIMQGAPEEFIDHHFKRLSGRAHISSINGQLAAARERSDITLFDQARDHLEKAKDFLSPDVYRQLQDRIDKERLIIVSESTYENLLTLATRDSSDEDARWVDEGELAKLIDSIEDPNVRSLVRKLANESKPLREAARKSVVDRYAAAALKTFWDTRSITSALNSEAMLWLGRNAAEEWNRVRAEMEKWALRWSSEARARESLDLRRQRQAAQDQENILSFWQLQEDMLMNPQKYAAEDYTVDTLMSEWGGRIPAGLHDRMFATLDKHKRRMQTEGYRLAQEHFRRAVNARRDKFTDANQRRAFVGVMYELYDQEIAPDQRPTLKDIERIIALADTQVLVRRVFGPNQVMTYAEALTGRRTILQYQDPNTGEWVEGPPPPGMSEDINVQAGDVSAPGSAQSTPTTTLVRPPNVDPDLWQRALDIAHPEDRNNLEVILQLVEILRQ